MSINWKTVKLWGDLMCSTSNWGSTPSNTTLDTVLRINGRKREDTIILNKPTIVLLFQAHCSYVETSVAFFMSETHSTHALSDSLLP